MPSEQEAIRLHSRYNPRKEAARYIEAQSFSCNPLFVVVTEPGESYLAQELRARYPDASLLAIRYDKALFSETDGLWDGVWRPGTGFEVASWLFAMIPDECLPLTVFLPWKPSDSAWPSLSSYVWNSIASVIRLQTSVMYTRSAFGKRWLANCVRNAILARNLTAGEVSDKPALLVASGPSLESLFPFNRESFYVCAVSSAISCLSAHGVTPDLCIATDGGYWALNHFRDISERVTVAFPCEAAIPSRVLERNPVQFLDYGSAIERKLLFLAGVKAEQAARNGTVSGTAALYLLAHTPANVYAAGLDLCPSQSFSHARPSANAPSVDAATARTRPLCLSLHESSRDTASLDMYAAWFSSRDDAFKRRFFRIGSAGKPLEGIASVPLREIGAHAAQSALAASGAKPEQARGDVQNARSREERKEALAAWLSGVVESFERADGVFSDDAISVELLQMVSYTGFIKYLKRRQNPSDDALLASAFQDLRGDAVAFLSRLEGFVRRITLA
jgi:hypothetical protein